MISNKHPRRTCLVLLISSAVLAFAAPAQNLKVTLLGTGSPEPRIDRFGPSILVEAGEKKLLFDCGPGALNTSSTSRLRSQKSTRCSSHTCTPIM